MLLSQKRIFFSLGQIFGSVNGPLICIINFSCLHSSQWITHSCANFQTPFIKFCCTNLICGWLSHFFLPTKPTLAILLDLILTYLMDVFFVLFCAVIANDSVSLIRFPLHSCICAILGAISLVLFCAVMASDSVSLLRFPLHSCVILGAISLVCLLKYPHSFFLFLFLPHFGIQWKIFR